MREHPNLRNMLVPRAAWTKGDRALHATISAGLKCLRVGPRRLPPRPVEAPMRWVPSRGSANIRSSRAQSKERHHEFRRRGREIALRFGPNGLRCLRREVASGRRRRGRAWRRTRFLPGHTPGHSWYWISSSADQLLIWTDVVQMRVIQITRPEVTIDFAADPDSARSTRFVSSIKSRRRVPIAGMHINMSGILRRRAACGGYAKVDLPTGRQGRIGSVVGDPTRIAACWVVRFSHGRTSLFSV